MTLLNSPQTAQKLRSLPTLSPNPLILVVLELLLALPLGLALSKLGIGGVAWLLSGVASGALVFYACRIFHNYSAKPNAKARKIGQALVGLTIGFSISHSNLANIAPDLPIFVFLTLFILISGCCIGYIYSRISQTNLLTAMLATVPGSIGIMSSLAAEYGRNVSQVSLVQILRFTTVILFIPVVARTVADNFTNLTPSPLKHLSFEFTGLNSGLLILALILATLGVKLAKLLKIPAAPFFGSLLVGITFNALLGLVPFLTGLDFNPPSFISVIGQIFLGITIGEYWSSQPILEKEAILHALIPVGLTIGAGLVAAEIANLITPWDWLTCMLVTAPGGAPEMILVALALDHNVEVVTAGHLVRLIAINSSLPLWVFLFRKLDERLPNSDND